MKTYREIHEEIGHIWFWVEENVTRYALVGDGDIHFDNFKTYEDADIALCSIKIVEYNTVPDYGPNWGKEQEKLVVIANQKWIDMVRDELVNIEKICSNEMFDYILNQIYCDNLYANLEDLPVTIRSHVKYVKGAPI